MLPKKTSAVLIPPEHSAKIAKYPQFDDKFPQFRSAYQTLGMPSTITAKVLNFGTNAHPATSSEDERSKNEECRQLPLLPKRKNISPVSQQAVQETNIESQNNQSNTNNKMDTDEYQFPKRTKKFRTNFVKLLEQKAAATIRTKNRYEAISESESDTENEPTTSKTKGKATATPNIPIKGNSQMQKNIKTATKSKPKLKDNIQPIVIDGSTDNLPI